MLELKVPPPIQMAIFAAIMGLMGKYLPQLSFNLPISSGISFVLLMAGIVIAALGIIEFKKAQTTVNPHQPNKASQLVSKGIYKFSRNPMYVGLLLVLTAWAFQVSNFLAFLCLPLFLGYMTRFQILPEEKVLLEKFGSEFDDYRQNVRRWI